MKRWDANAQAHVEHPAADAFLAEISDVCRRHGFAIGHEDAHGAFQVVPFSEATLDWLMSAGLADGAGDHGGGAAPPEEDPLANPRWDEAERVHDWRNHVPEDVREMWPALSPDGRRVAWIMARAQADTEEWD